jgi:peptidoglycan/LPS O-acetylase OafA/YrhL
MVFLGVSFAGEFPGWFSAICPLYGQSPGRNKGGRRRCPAASCAARSARYAAVMTSSPPVEQRSQTAEEEGRNLGLDLLRALAILLVMASHYANNVGYWFGWRPPQRLFFLGDLGVELFFALSGFLIGRILIATAARAATLRGYGVFMLRRWMRTLPLYYLWLAFLLAAWPPARHAGAEGLRFLTLTQNLVQPMPADDFFAVSWSLTIEEWFYLLFGGLFLLAARLLRSPSAALALVLAAFLLGPLLLRLAALDYSPAGIGRMKQVFFRIDEIGYGVAMAWLFMRRSMLFRHPWPALVAGLGLLGFAWDWWHLPIPYALKAPLIYNATVIGCALCLPAALRLRRAPCWVSRPVRLISAWSYTLYLVHSTVLVDLVQNELWEPGRLSPPAAAVVAVLLPFVLAALSFRFIETPVLRRRPRAATRPAAAALAVGGPA